MFTKNFASHALNRALQILTAVVALFAAILVMSLATSALAEEDFASEVIRLVNVERAKVGVAALEEDVELIPAANVRAEEASRKFSHTRPNGSKWKTVFNEYEIQSFYRGENLAEGQKTPEAVVKAWMASEGHRKNILNGEFDHIAVGLYEKGGVLYWSQLFIQAKASSSVPAGAENVIFTGVEAVAGQYAQVMDVDLNVRTSASSKADVVAVAAEGSALIVLEINGGWALVRMGDGTEGWASMKYLAA